MHTEREHIDPDELAKMGYERRDVNTKILGKTVGVFYAFAIVSALFAAWILFIGFRIPIPFTGRYIHVFDPYMVNTTTQQKRDEENRIGRILPKSPNPLLQGNVTAKLDMQTLRQAEDARLTGTGYADEAKTRAFIPIDRAMDLLAERGLPQTATEAAVSKGNDMEPFGTGTVQPPVRNGSAGDTTITPAPAPSTTSPDAPVSSPAEGGAAAPQSTPPVQGQVPTRTPN